MDFYGKFIWSMVYKHKNYHKIFSLFVISSFLCINVKADLVEFIDSDNIFVLKTLVLYIY